MSPKALIIQLRNNGEREVGDKRLAGLGREGIPVWVLDPRQSRGQSSYD